VDPSCSAQYAGAPCPPPPPHFPPGGGQLPFTGAPGELVLLLGLAVVVFALAGLAIYSERAR
jgi:hypothetical protein